MFLFFQVFLKKNDGTLLPLRPVVSGPIREKKEKPTSNNLVPAESSSSSSSSDSPLQIRSVSCSSVSAAEGRRGVAVVCERRVADKEEIEVTAFVTIAPFYVKMQSNLKTQVRLERRDEATGSRLWSHCVPSAEVRVTPAKVVEDATGGDDFDRLLGGLFLGREHHGEESQTENCPRRESAPHA